MDNTPPMVGYMYNLETLTLEDNYLMGILPETGDLHKLSGFNYITMFPTINYTYPPVSQTPPTHL